MTFSPATSKIRQNLQNKQRAAKDLDARVQKMNPQLWETYLWPPIEVCSTNQSILRATGVLLNVSWNGNFTTLKTNIAAAINAF